MSRGLAIVVNANANRGRFMRRGLGLLRTRLRGDERLFVTRRLADLDGVVETLAADPPNTLGLVGGDGTITASLSALYAATGALPPKLLLLRGGTMNTVATGLGIRRGDPLLRLAEYRRRSGETGRLAQTLDVGGRLGFLFSAGLMHGFLAEYYDQPFGTGHLGAATLLARGVGSALASGPLARRLATPVTASLSVDGRPIERRQYLFVGAATVPEVGIGFRPYGRMAGDGGPPAPGFQVLAYSGPIGRLVRDLPAFARGRSAHVPGTLDEVCCALRIEPAASPFKFALDGDLHEVTGPLHLRLGPTVRVLG